MSSIEQFSTSEIVQALLTHDTIQQAADSIGANEKTLRRRMREEGFDKEMETARWEGLEVGLAKLQMALPTAVDTIIKVMKDSPDPKLKYQAAARLIELGTRFTDLLDNKMQQVSDA